MNLTELDKFFEYVKNKKILTGNGLNNWVVATAAVKQILQDDEATIEYALQNRDTIKNRLQNENTDLSGSTLGEYVNRFYRAIENFQAWKADRAAWEKSIAAKAKSRPTISGSRESSKAEVKGENPTEKGSAKVLPIPVGQGRSFEVRLPDDYVMNDLVRVVWALAVYASDFDPAAVLDRFGKPAPDFSERNAREIGKELEVRQ